MHLVQCVKYVLKHLESRQKTKETAKALALLCCGGGDHHIVCYFCMINIFVFNSKIKRYIVYLNLPSAIRPVPHSENFSPAEVMFFVDDSDDENE